MTLRILALSSLLAFGAVAGAPAARAMPAAALEQGAAAIAPVSEVRHRGRSHKVYRAYPRPRLYVYPGAYAYPYPYAYYGSRGFEDPGYAYHGNMTGNCAVDLGYGRYETCDH